MWEYTKGMWLCGAPVGEDAVCKERWHALAQVRGAK